MEHYLYFAEGGGADASTEAICYPASKFVGVEPITATTTGIYFESAVGDVDGGGGAGRRAAVCQISPMARNTLFLSPPKCPQLLPRQLRMEKKQYWAPMLS